MARLAVATWQGANPKNYTVTRSGKSLKYVTIHHTAANNTSLASLYANPARQGSAHFFVSANKIEQYVDTKDTAWTNGNFTSNSESITIEVNGDWRGGYYNQNTINNLKKLLKAIVDTHGRLTMTFHKDVSDKATACPAELKDKGYAINAYNEVLNTNNQGGNEVTLSTDAVKTLYKRLFNREGDTGGVKNYTGKSLDFALGDMLGSQEFKNSHVKTVTVEKPVEKIVTKEVFKDNPAHLTRIAELEKQLAEKPVNTDTKWETFKSLIRELIK